eukprot:TRINITY_DN832_c1_g1_i4.p1 TRINITY_DN832_c1_g1~~TRINITY_DN832_c1_g1_i4.p1  ORF type:complete len:340 (-),score=79.67 TRINITY_DN832_c1_g1_i4:927-1946(-)
MHGSDSNERRHLTPAEHHTRCLRRRPLRGVRASPRSVSRSRPRAQLPARAQVATGTLAGEDTLAMPQCVREWPSSPLNASSALFGSDVSGSSAGGEDVGWDAGNGGEAWAEDERKDDVDAIWSELHTLAENLRELEVRVVPQETLPPLSLEVHTAAPNGHHPQLQWPTSHGHNSPRHINSRITNGDSGQSATGAGSGGTVSSAAASTPAAFADAVGHLAVRLRGSEVTAEELHTLAEWCACIQHQDVIAARAVAMQILPVAAAGELSEELEASRQSNEDAMALLQEAVEAAETAQAEKDALQLQHDGLVQHAAALQRENAAMRLHSTQQQQLQQQRFRR